MASLDDLFNELVMKGKDNASLGSVSTGTPDSSSGGSDLPSSVGIQLDFGTSNLPPSTTKTPPVGNQDGLFQLDWGYGPNSKNVEKDEDDKPFETYKDTRSFKADVISFVERTYFDTGELPEYRALHETFKDYPEAPKFIKGWKEIVDDLFEQLEVRGLPTFKTSESYLDPRFITACNILLNIHDTRSDSAKLKELEITSAQWNAWLKAKKYQEYYQKRADKVFDEDIQVEAKRTVAKLVKNGDLSAVKYLNEWNGTYRAADNTTQMMQVFMTAILAILARNVPSNVINVIGAELREDPGIKSLLGGQLAIESQAS